MTVSYSYLMNHDTYEVKKASVDWEGANQEYKKTVDDFQSLGRDQEETEVNAGSEGSLILGHSDFKLEELQASLWQDNEEIKLYVNQFNEFKFPDSKGKYTLEVNLSTDSGNVQYVGNINLN
ncbi:hypothetical protein DYE48_15130 [Halobacillus trueperi]|uniref:Uncharacterized protein n=2 Tax=Halobacillus trueperi TaxID=156205 RepID=A0A3E0J510_9BACI|nr:hypothetical protein DYE48_15130 [Halobacillus trueperi]